MTEPELSNPAHRTRPAVIVLAMLLACLPLLALAQFIAHTRTDEFDSWLFAHFGRELLGGRTLYRDLWDNKPPGIFWLNALGLWLARGELWGVYALCAAAVAAAAAIVFATARRLYGLSAAAIAAVLAALYLNIHLYHVGCDRPSTFLVTSELACFGLYCAALTARRGGWALLILAGVCGGLGPCLHQSGVAMSAAVLLHGLYLSIRRGLRWPAVLGRLILFGVGWCLAVGGAVFAIYRTSDPHWAWDAVVSFNRLYFKADEGASFVPRFFAVEEHLKVLGLPLILALATLVQPLLRRFVGGGREGERAHHFRRSTEALPVRSGSASVTASTPTDPAREKIRARLVYPHAGAMRASSSQSEAVVWLPDDDPVGNRPDGLLFVLWAWMIVAIYLALLGPHQRLQYFGVALPPLVMICAHAVHLLLRAGRRIDDMQPAYPVVIGVLWFGYMMVWPVHSQIREAVVAHHRRFEEPPEPRHVALVQALHQHTEPGDAIFVSGYGPKLYWDAERHSAIRYIGTEKVGQLGDHGRPLMQEIARLLMAAEPKAIVIEAERPMDSVHPRLTDVPELDEWIDRNYVPLPDYEYNNLWIRANGVWPRVRPLGNGI